MGNSDSLSLLFYALSDPTRRSILAALLKSESSVTEITAPYSMSLPAVTKHLKVLEKAGLITRGKQAQWRPCQLKAEKLKEVDDWMSIFRRHWEESFDRLDEYLQSIQTTSPKGSKHGKSRKTK